MLDLQHGITYIYFRFKGEEVCWGIAASPYMDTSDTLREHLEKWRPDTEFIRAEYHTNGDYQFTYGVKPFAYHSQEKG